MALPARGRLPVNTVSRATDIFTEVPSNFPSESGAPRWAHVSGDGVYALPFAHEQDGHAIGVHAFQFVLG